jgi:exopolysaccharide production protein ExoQ
MLKLPATLFCIGLLFYLFRMERRDHPELSAGLWISCIWFIIVATRPISAWLSSGGREITSEAVETGSPIDRFVFSLLLLLALWCLARRELPWASILRENRGFLLLFLFALVSALWSEYPLVSFKRWVRGVGAASAALIVVTERSAFSAFTAVLRRTSYLVIPLSVLTIKYYREIGVGYGVWGGVVYRGLTGNKNMLGRVCLLAIVYFAFVLLYRQFTRGEMSIRAQFWIAILYLGMSIWLLHTSKSATSLATCLLAGGLLLAFRLGGPSRGWFHFLILLCVPVFVVLVFSFEAVPRMASLFGRDPTLTDRTEIWSDLLQIRGNSLVGTGYGGFWIGERLDFLWARWSWLPNSAHNGYLELFLQLGIVGVTLLIGCIALTYSKLATLLRSDFAKGIFCYVWLLIFVLYNITESATFLDSMMWFVFTLYAFRYKTAQVEEEGARAYRDTAEGEVADKARAEWVSSRTGR